MDDKFYLETTALLGIFDGGDSGRAVVSLLSGKGKNMCFLETALKIYGCRVVKACRM